VEGFLVEPGNVDLMARRALEILGDERRLRDMGREARRAARDRFCATKIIPRYEAYYRRIVESS
jgi:glycosyltransferase involved in cell wall biosynthesis